MRVVILTETYAKNMGYLGNMLPKHLARLGADVHVLTLDLPPYYSIKDFKETYDGFHDKNGLRPGVVEQIDGYTLHVMGHERWLGHMRMKDLGGKLRELRPDVVYSLAAIGWLALQAGFAKVFMGFKLFTGSHTTASVFPMSRQENLTFSPRMWRNVITRSLPGRMVSLVTEKCYAATADCADVAVRFFGVQQSKIDVIPLGVDTETFHPIVTADDRQRRLEVREKFGFGKTDIACIYTGRFSNEKNPVVLARAIEQLRRGGAHFHGLFFGDGLQRAEIEAIDHCVVHPFVPVDELGDYFRAVDIGVWPTQESTSMLDAAACGLPIVVNDTLQAIERVEGNGLQYKLNNVDDLVAVLSSLTDPERRGVLGDAGAKKMKSKFSWDSLARRRLTDFDRATKSAV